MNRVAAIALALLVATQAHAAGWVSSWTAAPQAIWDAGFPLPTNAPVALDRQTIRQVARLSVGGKRIRLVLSNEYGTSPLQLGAVHVARASKAGTIEPGSDRVVTFGGQGSIAIPPGAPATSDAIDLAVPALTDLAVSLYFPDATKVTTFHWDGGQTAYLGDGDQTGSSSFAARTTLLPRILLRAIEVENDADIRTVVAIGDSITDGAASTPDANHRWPDFLAARLAPQSVAVLNAGISGGRLLRDGMGVNALARLERDVLAQPRLATVVVLIGINDIAWPGHAFAPAEPRPSRDMLVAGYRQLIERAHARGVRVVGATLPPFEGALEATPLAGYYSADRDRLRQAVNDWIRTSGAFDAVIDWDRLLRDPARPARFLPAYDSGDHLHPGDRGYQAMADSLAEPLLFPGP